MQQYTPLLEESVTTTDVDGIASGSLSKTVNEEVIFVTFDGIGYECPRLEDGSFGAPYNESTDTVDWSAYPFAINKKILMTKEAGTHSVKIEVISYQPKYVDPCLATVIAKLLPPCNTITVPAPLKTEHIMQRLYFNNSIAANQTAQQTVQYNVPSNRTVKSISLTNVSVGGTTGLETSPIIPKDFGVSLGSDNNITISILLYNASSSDIKVDNLFVAISFNYWYTDSDDKQYSVMMCGDDSSTPVNPVI